MGYKGVIFDLDGTLVNSIEDIGNSLNRVLIKHGQKERTLQEYTDRIGQGLYQLVIDSVEEDTDTESIDLIFQDFLEDYSHNYMVKTEAYKGIHELLETLSSQGIKLGVNSNKKDEFTKDIVETVFKNVEFTLVLGDREGVNKKPDPTSAIEIVEAMNLSSSEVVYIGDTDHDMHTASNANLDAIGVSWGYRTLDLLKKEGARYTVESPKEIISIVL